MTELCVKNWSRERGNNIRHDSSQFVKSSVNFLALHNKNVVSFLHRTQSGVSASLKVIKSAIAITMSSIVPPQTNSVPDTDRYLLDVIVDSVVNLHYKNIDKFPIIPSPLSTADTSVTVSTAATASQEISVPVSNI